MFVSKFKDVVAPENLILPEISQIHCQCTMIPCVLLMNLLTLFLSDESTFSLQDGLLSCLLPLSVLEVGDGETVTETAASVVAEPAEDDGGDRVTVVVVVEPLDKGLELYYSLENLLLI